MEFRIGYGYDVHSLSEGLRLIIGGVEIEHSKGFVAHSDGDVLAHAIADALLGAVAKGDIGTHFPDTDEKYRGADSLKLLARVMEVVSECGYELGNVDATVVAQRPKLRPFIDEMREKLAAAMGVEIGKVSVKATTEEGLGFTGSEQGISAHAVVLICRVGS